MNHPSLRLSLLTLALALSACTKSESPAGSAPSASGAAATPGAPGNSEGQEQNEDEAMPARPAKPQRIGPGGCRAPEIVANANATCRVRLVSPSPCATVDLTNGKTVRFQWAAEGAGCQLPWRVQLAGHPLPIGTDGRPSGENSNQYELGRSQLVGSKGGSVDAGAGAFEGLTTDDGTYEWRIEGSQGAGTQGVVIKVQM